MPIKPAQPMMILQLFLKINQVVKYYFTDAERAVRARDACAEALNLSRAHPPKQAVCRFVDDSRKEAIWDGADLCGVEIFEMHEVIEIETRVAIMAQRHSAELREMAGAAPPSAVNGAVGPQGATHPPYVDSAVRDAGAQAPPVASISRFAT